MPLQQYENIARNQKIDALCLDDGSVMMRKSLLVDDTRGAGVRILPTFFTHHTMTTSLYSSCKYTKMFAQYDVRRVLSCNQEKTRRMKHIHRLRTIPQIT